MKFTRTLIAAGILSALGSVATAQSISLSETITASNLQSFEEVLKSEASQNVGVIADSMTAFAIMDGNHTISGSGKSVDFKFSGEIHDNGHAAVRFFKKELADSTDKITFDNFKDLNFTGDNIEASSWILGLNTQFGSEANRLNELTFTNISLLAWAEDSDLKVDVFANNFSIDTNINVGANDLTLSFHGAEAGTYGGKQNFEGGIKTSKPKLFTINGGELVVGSIDGTDAIYATSGSNLTINAQSLTTGGMDNSNTAGIHSYGTTTISTGLESQSIIGGNIYVGEAGRLSWTRGGDVTINGNVRNDGTSLLFGAKGGESIKNLTINATKPSEDIYPSGFLTGSSYVGAENFTLNGALLVNGNAEFKSSSATITAYDNQGSSSININNRGSLKFLADESAAEQKLVVTSTNQAAISIGSSSSMTVEAGSIDVTGGIASSDGTIYFGSTDKALSSISIKSNESINNVLSLGNGTKANLYSSGDIKISGAIAEGKKAIDLSGEESELNLVTEASADIDGAVVITSGKGNIEGSNIDISGYLHNKEGTVSLKGKNITVSTPEDADYRYYMGIHSNGSTKINSDSLTVTGGLTIGADKFDITSSSTVINATGRNAASVSNGAQLIFNAAQEAENQTLVLNSTDAGAALVSSEAKLAVTTGNMSAIGSVQSNGGIIELGTEGAALNTVSIVNNTSGASTLRSNGGNVSVYADQVLISNEGKTAIDAFTYQREDSKEGDTGLLKIHGNKAVSITGDIVAGKDSNELDRDYVRENSIIEIDSDGLTQIKGNLYTFNSDSYKTGKYDENNPQSGITSGETSNVIKLTLNGSDSSLTGSIVDEGATTETGTSLNLNDGASWNLTGDSTVNTINSDSGFINTDGNQLVADTLTNNEGGTTIETSSGKANQIHIHKVEGEGLGIHLTDEATSELDANNPQEALAAIASIENSDSSYSITSDEAGVLGDMQLVMDKDGNVVSFTEKANTVNEGLQDIAASNYLFFRSSMNDVNKRMGDLRTMPKTSGGAWARYYGGEMKYGDMNMETTYNTLQVGADGWIDNFYLGASASISDGNGDLDNGSVDNRNYNFGVYGGWVSDNGQFVDVIVKRHRMETDGKLRSTAGAKNAFDYYNWGTSVSVEYGWRFNCPSTNFWVEPQAELMYGRLDSVDFRTSQGARVSQDAVESLIGRLGASVGYTFDQNRGSAYFKASVLHDWKGETDSDVTANGATRSFHDDLGGTWGEFALGGTYNVTDSFSAYGDVMTTTGSPVRNPWQISVGVRYTF